MDGSSSRYLSCSRKDTDRPWCGSSIRLDSNIKRSLIRLEPSKPETGYVSQAMNNQLQSRKLFYNHSRGLKAAEHETPSLGDMF